MDKIAAFKMGDRELDFAGADPETRLRSRH
jgi:hypothetical protein